MSTPPTTPESGGGEADTTAGQQGPTQDMIRGWMDQHIQYAHLNRLQGTGMPFAPVAVVPPIALYGATLAAGGIHDPLGHYYAYCQQQRLNALNQHQVHAAIPGNSSQHAPEMPGTRFQQPSHTSHGGGVPPIHLGGYLDLLSPSGAQDQQIRELETTNEVIYLETDQPRAESVGGSLEEATKRRITEKIKEKLRKLKTNLSDSNHNAVLEPLIREQEPQPAPPNELNVAGQIVGLKGAVSPIESRRDYSGKRPSVSTETPSVPPLKVQAQAKRPSASGEIPSKIQPQAKKRRTGGATTKKQPVAQTQIANSLDKTIDSLEDENIRSALQEDRENLRAKRSAMQEIYEEQIRENLKSRIAMYTKLQILARQIETVRSNGNPKNSRNSNHMDGAIDMIHLGLRNYRMLEDTSDCLIGALSKKIYEC